MKISPIVCTLVFALELVLLLYGLHVQNLPLAIVLILLTTLLFLNLFSMSVRIDREAIRISYGLGLLSKVIPLQEIQGMQVVPNSSLAWLYDMRRDHVLKLTLRGGGKTLVGIGDPKKMMEIIGNCIRR